MDTELSPLNIQQIKIWLLASLLEQMINYR